MQYPYTLSARSSQAAVNLNYADPSLPLSPSLPHPPLPQVTKDQTDCSLLRSKAYHWLRAESERARPCRGPPLCLSSWGGPSAPPCGPAPGGPLRPRVGPRWGVRGCGDGGGDVGLPDTTQVNRSSGQTGASCSACEHESAGVRKRMHAHTHTHTHTHLSFETYTQGQLLGCVRQQCPPQVTLGDLLANVCVCVSQNRRVLFVFSLSFSDSLRLFLTLSPPVLTDM